MADDNKVHDDKPRNINRLILTALGGTFAVTIIVTIISAIFRPAHVTFSITHASSKAFNNGSASKLSITVAAHNPSRRCKASYRSVFIDLKNSTTAAGKSSIHANILNATFFPTGYIEGPNVTLIDASATILRGDVTAEASSFAKVINDRGLTAVVRALVRFRVGVISTGLYEMKVSCPGVLFPKEGSSAQQRDFICSG